MLHQNMPQMDHTGGQQQKPQKYGQLQQPHQFKQQHQYGGQQPQQQQVTKNPVTDHLPTGYL